MFSLVGLFLISYLMRYKVSWWQLSLACDWAELKTMTPDQQTLGFRYLLLKILLDTSAWGKDNCQRQESTIDLLFFFFILTFIINVFTNYIRLLAHYIIFLKTLLRVDWLPLMLNPKREGKNMGSHPFSEEAASVIWPYPICLSLGQFV